jgi:hypothetical protein
MYTEKIFINCILQVVSVVSIDFLKLKCQNILSKHIQTADYLFNDLLRHLWSDTLNMYFKMEHISFIHLTST